MANFDKEEEDLKCNLMDTFSCITTYLSQSFGTLCIEEVSEHWESIFYDIYHLIRECKDNALTALVDEVLEDIDDYTNEYYTHVKSVATEILEQSITTTGNCITHTNAMLYKDLILPPIKELLKHTNKIYFYIKIYFNNYLCKDINNKLQ